LPKLKLNTKGEDTFPHIYSVRHLLL
jgi:hypothetical protein